MGTRFYADVTDVVDIDPINPKTRSAKKALLVLAAAGLFGVSAHIATSWLQSPGNTSILEVKSMYQSKQSEERPSAYAKSKTPQTPSQGTDEPLYKNVSPTLEMDVSAASANAVPANDQPPIASVEVQKSVPVKTPSPQRSVAPMQDRQHKTQPLALQDPKLELIDAIVEHHASGNSQHTLADLIRNCTGSDPIEKALCMKTICRASKSNSARSSACS